MHARAFSSGTRGVATFTLSAMIIVVLGSTGGLAVLPETGDEGCVGCSGCSGCETGQCHGQGEDPLTSHHHCCVTCCMSHTPLTQPAALWVQTPANLEPMPACTPVVIAGPAPESPFRPPRV